MSRVRTPDGVPNNRGLIVTLYFYVDKKMVPQKWLFLMVRCPGNHEFPDHEKNGSVKNVGVEDTPRISEPLSFFEKTLFSSAPTGVSHR